MKEMSELKSIVLESEDLKELRITYLDLTDMSGNIYKSIHKVETQTEQTELKANLTQINALIKVCDERISELKDENGRLNHNFRMNARLMLKKETYNKIMELSYYRRSYVKDCKNELKANRLE